eukprot:8640554-Pyramimonas_sp.AAC.1
MSSEELGLGPIKVFIHSPVQGGPPENPTVGATFGGFIPLGPATRSGRSRRRCPRIRGGRRHWS